VGCRSGGRGGDRSDSSGRDRPEGDRREVRRRRRRVLVWWKW